MTDFNPVMVESIKKAMGADITKESFKLTVRTQMREDAPNRHKRSYIEREKELMTLINQIWKSLLS